MWNVDRCYKESFLLFVNQLLVQKLILKTKHLKYLI